MMKTTGNPRRREAQEARENDQLAPYGMRSGESAGRRHDESADPYRTSFQRDRDRIVHCSAFRRLENKTQVFVSHTGDYYRTRLTHTLEVAQIARSMARIFGLNEDLTEGVALAHDLGHTPFGHSGGDVLDDLMKGHGGFEHNHQSLRIVDVLEERYPGFRGLNLSYEVRESIVKHKRPFMGPAYADYRPDDGPLLEAQLVDVCDGIAYNSHDVDDGFAAGILEEEEVYGLEIMRAVGERIESKWPGLRGRMLRIKYVSELIDYLLHDLIENTSATLASLQLKSIADVRALDGDAVGFSKEVSRQEKELRRFLYANFYTHHRVHGMRHRARVFIEGLFNAYVGNPKLMPPRFQHRVEEFGLERTVADYIAGMTDSYAESEYRKMFYPFERS